MTSTVVMVEIVAWYLLPFLKIKFCGFEGLIKPKKKVYERTFCYSRFKKTSFSWMNNFFGFFYAEKKLTLLCNLNWHCKICLKDSSQQLIFPSFSHSI